MAAMVNGMALHGGVRPYVATFFVFVDYMRPAMRLAALMELPVIYVFTHDSIGVGEDGPTHQPVEHLAMLRAIPNLTDLRPADANETAEAWKIALQHEDGPVGLVLTRQNLPTIDRAKYAPASGVARGAYVLGRRREGGAPDVLLMASGSEVHWPSRRTSAWWPRACAHAWSTWRPGSCSSARTPTIARMCCRRVQPPAGGRGRRHVRLGALGRRRRRGHRPRPLRRLGPGRDCSSSSSASPPRTSTRRPRPCWTAPPSRRRASSRPRWVGRRRPLPPGAGGARTLCFAPGRRQAAPRGVSLPPRPSGARMCPQRLTRSQRWRGTPRGDALPHPGASETPHPLGRELAVVLSAPVAVVVVTELLDASGWSFLPFTALVVAVAAAAVWLTARLLGVRLSLGSWI